jgi:hypothetical protein
MQFPTEFIVPRLQLDICQALKQGILGNKPLALKSLLKVTFGGDVSITLVIVSPL